MNDMTARQAWKKYYRLVRVMKREGLKAAIDTMMFGTGAVFLPDDTNSDPYHVPFSEIIIKGVDKK